MDRGKKKGKAKVDKPLAERKRRARINDALLQLKSIVLQSIKNESTMMSKLEKADILEMTVEYIHRLQHFQTNPPADPQLSSEVNSAIFDGSQYSSGFNECASHVAECINALPETDDSNDNIKTRLLEHLVSVASTSDFRDKSKQQDMHVAERNVNGEINATSSSEDNFYDDVSLVSQNGVSDNGNNLTSVPETFSAKCLKTHAEAPNTLSDTTYTNLEHAVCNTYNYQYPMYTALYNGLFSLQEDSYYESLSSEERVSNASFILLPTELPYVLEMKNDAYATALVDEHHNMESNINTTICDTETDNMPDTTESGMFTGPFEGNDSKTVPQTLTSQIDPSQVQCEENKADTNNQDEVTMVTEDEQAVQSPIPVTGNSDTIANVDNISDAIVADTKSTIMTIPKKRKVLGDFTNVSNSNRTSNIKSTTKTSLTCEHGLTTHIRSPKKSKKKSPIKESRQIPRPIKKRIAASVFEQENENGNHVTVNVDANKLLSQVNNQDVSNIYKGERHDGRKDGYELMDTSCKIREKRSNNRVRIDGSNVRYCQDNSQHHGSMANENLNTLLPRNGNKLPPINTFQELISAKYPNRHCSQNRSRDHVLPQMDQSSNNDFYQNYFGQNSSGNVWRPW